MDLTKTFAREQYARGLEAWSWIGVGRRVPLFASVFGDVCFEAPDGYWWLDTVDGTLSKQWETAEELNAELETPEGQERYLFGGLVLDAELRGLVPGPDEVLGFTVAPSVGGGYGVDNLEVIDFVTRLHMSGQLHGWTRKLSTASSGTPAPVPAPSAVLGLDRGPGGAEPSRSGVAWSVWRLLRH